MDTAMRALVLHDNDGRIEQRPIPVAGPTDVVVRTTVASLCSADVACVQGVLPTPAGTVLGHEAVGVVHEAGELVTGFESGQRVAVASTTPCGGCENCQRGYAGHCGGVAWGGYTFGVSRDGSLAEYVAVPQAAINLAVIPEAVGDEAALCATDTLLSGTTAAESAGVPLGGTVAVFGVGHVGLAAAYGARQLGAALVVSVKARPGGGDLARAMGADVVLNLTDHDVEKEIRERTCGQGVDVAIEATGCVDAFPRAVAVTRLGGVIAVLSSYTGPPGATLPIPLEHWGWGIGDKTIVGAFQRCGSERLGRLLRLIEAGRIDPQPLLTHTYRLDEAPRALAALAAREPGLVKPLIRF
jgi:threonine dehydrogenase-like Zn-dependent dehydrogenase